MTSLDLCLGVSGSGECRKQLLPQSMAHSRRDLCNTSFPVVETQKRTETLRESRHLTKCACVHGQNGLGCVNAACEKQGANQAARSTKQLQRIHGAFKTSSI